MEELVERFILTILALPNVRAALVEIVRSAGPKRRQLDLPVAEAPSPPPPKRKPLRLEIGGAKQKRAAAKKFVDLIVDAGVMYSLPSRGVEVEWRRVLSSAANGMVLDPTWIGMGPSHEWLRYFAAAHDIEFLRDGEPVELSRKIAEEIRSEIKRRLRDFPLVKWVKRRVGSRPVGFDRKAMTYWWGPKSVPRSTGAAGRPAEKSDW